MTPTRQLADIKLGGKLDEFVTTARARGDSWRSIARDMHTATGLVVSDETLRNWFLALRAPSGVGGAA